MYEADGVVEVYRKGGRDTKFFEETEYDTKSVYLLYPPNTMWFPRKIVASFDPPSDMRFMFFTSPSCFQEDDPDFIRAFCEKLVVPFDYLLMIVSMDDTTRIRRGMMYSIVTSGLSSLRYNLHFYRAVKLNKCSLF